ncbi:MAG: hypothetical protein AAGA18_14750 [Verrucomicrobiota bacterium]
MELTESRKLLFGAIEKANGKNWLETFNGLCVKKGYINRIQKVLFSYPLSALIIEFGIILTLSLIIGFSLKLIGIQQTPLSEMILISIILTHWLLVLTIMILTPRGSLSPRKRFDDATTFYSEFCISKNLDPGKNINQLHQHYTKLNNFTKPILCFVGVAFLVPSLLNNIFLESIINLDIGYAYTISKISTWALLFLIPASIHWYIRVFCPLCWCLWIKERIDKEQDS